MLHPVQDKVRECLGSGERRVSLWGEPQLPVLGQEDPLSLFGCLRRKMSFEDSSHENCRGLALNLQNI